MDDLRQSVSLAAHRVLDILDTLTNPEPLLGPISLLKMAKIELDKARRATSNGTAASHATSAAAWLIAYAEAHDRQIAKYRGGSDEERSK